MKKQRWREEEEEVPTGIANELFSGKVKKMITSFCIRKGLFRC